MNATHHRRAGITLIELLVVVAIIGLLAVTVLPNVSNTGESRRSREAAREVSGVIAKAQARAVGRSEWSGFMLAPTNLASSYAAVDLFLAEVPAVYRGDTVPTLVTVGAVTISGKRSATVTSGTIASGGVGAKVGDLVRFDGHGPWYELAAAPSVSGGLTFRMRGALFGNAATYAETEKAGYREGNTPWPPAGVPLSFEVVRQPVPAGSPVSLADGRCIDLYWSGYGPPQLTVGGVTVSGSTYRPFTVLAAGTAATAGASTSILFDGTGRLRQVVCGGNRMTVTGPVYLLVGRADRATGDPNPLASFSPADDATGANWQYQDSYWVAIDPATGVVKTAPCAPNPTGATALDRCVSSQAWIRRELVTEGK